jgi:hypothetical protein
MDEVNIMNESPNWPTEEEEQLIQEYMFLPAIRMALERDRKRIQAAKTKFEQCYLFTIDEAIHRVTQDMNKNKKKLFDLGIKPKRKDWFSYDVTTRGRIFDITYHKNNAADWINERIKDYLINQSYLIID